jgi:hypothetical protein
VFAGAGYAARDGGWRCPILVRPPDEISIMNTDLSWLRGQFIEAVEHDPHSWVFRFSSGGLLCAECPWRVVAHGGVAHGFEDHEQKFGLSEPVDGARRTLALISSQRVNDARIHPETCDLVLEFSAGARLEFFNCSSGYEGWILSSPEGRQFIAQGGGQLART